MIYLLDTYLIVKLIQADDSHISQKAKELFQDTHNHFIASTVSLWEMVIKYSIDKLELKEKPGSWLLEMAQDMGWSILNIEAQHIFQAGELPHYHNDPFDRLLVAQSQIEKIPLITPDKKFKKYDTKVIW